MIFNYFAIFGKLAEILVEFQKNGSFVDEQTLLNNQVSIEIVEAWSYVCQIFKLWPSVTLLKFYAAFFYFINFLAIGRIIVTDILFYSWYFIVINKYKELARGLKIVLEEKDSTKLKAWVEFHHYVNEYLLSGRVI